MNFVKGLQKTITPAASPRNIATGLAHVKAQSLAGTMDSAIARHNSKVMGKMKMMDQIRSKTPKPFGGG